MKTRWWMGVWKPFVILDALSKVEDGDYVLYCDCGDIVSPDIKSYVESVVSEDECCLLLLGNNTNKDYTKRDCFILMECDEADYWNSNQLEAGVLYGRRLSSQSMFSLSGSSIVLILASLKMILVSLVKRYLLLMHIAMIKAS